ncbi:hypothetical protein SDJN03_28494, partial [Cucurbita argyrosperma subsp. sororia]
MMGFHRMEKINEPKKRASAASSGASAYERENHKLRDMLKPCEKTTTLPVQMHISTFMQQQQQQNQALESAHERQGKAIVNLFHSSSDERTGSGSPLNNRETASKKRTGRDQEMGPSDQENSNLRSDGKRSTGREESPESESHGWGGPNKAPRLNSASKPLDHNPPKPP